VAHCCVMVVNVCGVQYIIMYAGDCKKSTSSHDKTGLYLRGVQIYLRQVNPARVRIWVISTVTAPNKHKSCKSCSSRTRPSATATMIAVFFWKKIIIKRKFLIKSDYKSMPFDILLYLETFGSINTSMRKRRNKIFLILREVSYRANVLRKST